KTRFDFPNPVIQAQNVRNLVAAVLKEKGQNEQINQSSNQGPALETLWQQCSGENDLVRTVCCEALVLLVEQGHADLQYVLNGVLNLLPSARNVQGLIKVIGQLLQIQADQRDPSKPFICPYSISSPHPYITALENREDCWAALLVEIDDFIRRAVDNEPAYITMLVPFLRYLYCEPQRLSQQAHLRHNLLRVLLQIDSVEAVLELQAFVSALLLGLVGMSERWEAERNALLLQLLCACEVPVDELMMGVALLLLEAPAAQLSSFLSLLQVPSLLPVLLFKLGREKRPELSNAVLNCLPNLGTHKLCVPMVLQTLHVLASAPKLRAVAMRLMTALWKKQDRVYPELQRLLSQQENRVVLGQDAQWEQLLSRAACLRDICIEPYQHGGDMLAAISLMLKQCTKPDLATPAALALQGLHELCRAEVVDIVSTWRTLGPELRADSRPLIVKATTELLALVPQLQVKSEAYEVRPVTKQHESGEDEEGKDKDEEEKDLSVPGSSYVKLLSLTPASVLPFQVFLTSLVKQEMEVMPRGVYFSALRQGGLRSDQGKTVAGIPSFMFKTYEKNKQPGLKPGLAGLLLCYELPVQTDRDGRPIDRFLMSRSRSYQQTLSTLIHEVNIQPSEWHRALLLPQAWRSFMSRAFQAILQGRRADLEMQQKQGKGNPEELQYQHHCAWLDSPVVQGNSILALSGLAAAVAKYESNLPTDSEGSLGAGPEFVPTSSWLAMVLDTLLSIICSGYKAKGQVFPWFLHRSYSGENTASAIARSCASLALSLLVPVLVVWQRDGVAQVLAALQSTLPGSPSADDSQVVQFHSGLALGMVLSSLHHQRLDISKQNDTELMAKGLDALESCSFNPNLEYTGCLLGLGLVLASLCVHGQPEQQFHVTKILNKLLADLQDSSAQSRMLQEVLAYSVACAGVSAFSAGLIDATKAEEIMATLRNLTEESQQTPGFSLALGLVVHGLSFSGHGKAEDIHPRLLAAWIKILLAEGCPTMQRLAAVNGLVALVGSETYLIQLKSESGLSSQQQSRLNEVIRAITQIITFSGAIGLQSNSACLVGHLYLAHMSTSHSHTAPLDFSYLPERSVIRAIIDFITEAGKKPEFFHPDLVKTALTPLASNGSSFQFPPINWSSVLSPLMRLGFEEVQHQCLVLAASQAQSSQSSALFLGSWISPPLVHSLSYRTQGHLYETLGVWMKHVAEDKLQVYVESLGLQHFQDALRPQRLSLCHSLLQGLAQAMSLPNPPNHCWSLLCSTTEKIFNLLPNNIQVTKRMEWLLELMGLIRNIVYGATSVSCGDAKMATDFLLQVFSAAVVSWGDHSMPLLLGIRAQWFPWFIDWLLSVTEAPQENISAASLSAVKCLLALKSCPDFKKKTTWTRAYGW
uniref:Uncharacterized protein n=1 Tax=Periophthalmus magnuspinnatus TaxID=409849 RepID=A0A3B3ZXC9_9GOBI